MQFEERAYHDIANAIILQAVEDYRDALNGKSYNQYSPEKIIKSIEKFFRSDYFAILTEVKGEYLIEQLRKEHLEKERSNDERNIDTGNT